MKLLTHDGVIVTLPFTMSDHPDNEFERLDGNGTATVGIVTEVDQREAGRAVLRASQLETAYLTKTQINNDLKFIARQLGEIADGVEVRLDAKGGRRRLVIPEDARPAREELKEGDSVAFNALVSPKALMNARGTVESVTGDRATVKLDAGDRSRVLAATGKQAPESVQAATSLLDKLADGN